MRWDGRPIPAFSPRLLTALKPSMPRIACGAFLWPPSPLIRRPVAAISVRAPKRRRELLQNHHEASQESVHQIDSLRRGQIRDPGSRRPSLAAPSISFHQDRSPRFAADHRRHTALRGSTGPARRQPNQWQGLQARIQPTSLHAAGKPALRVLRTGRAPAGDRSSDRRWTEPLPPSSSRSVGGHSRDGFHGSSPAAGTDAQTAPLRLQQRTRRSLEIPLDVHGSRRRR